MKRENKLQIRNSTAEFLIFTRQAGEGGIEVRVEDETVWLTQKLMAALFEVTIPTINEHLANLCSQGEIVKDSTIRNFRTVQKEGGRDVVRNVEFYNLDAIIAVGFRVNSARAIQFRQWATGVLRDYAIRGYVLDKERLHVSIHTFMPFVECREAVEKVAATCECHPERRRGACPEPVEGISKTAQICDLEIIRFAQR